MRMLKNRSERGVFLSTPTSFSWVSFGLLIATSIVTCGILFHILMNIVWLQGPAWVL